MEKITLALSSCRLKACDSGSSFADVSIMPLRSIKQPTHAKVSPKVSGQVRQVEEQKFTTPATTTQPAQGTAEENISHDVDTSYSSQ